MEFITKRGDDFSNPSISAEFPVGIGVAMNESSHRNKQSMARKLYVFNPIGRMKVDGKAKGTVKLIGGYSSNYTYLGDYHARLLGVGNHPSAKRLPSWLHTQPVGVKLAKGGASRSDPGFRGWG